MSILRTSFRITSDTSIGAIVAEKPGLSRVFDRLGIDYCCGGKDSLATACAAKGLDPDTVVVLLDAAAQMTDERPPIDAANMSLSDLVDHIETTHHRYVKEETPSLVEKADRVSARHGDRDARLIDVAQIIRVMVSEIIEHAEDEEARLFPRVRELEKTKGKPAEGASLTAIIEELEQEHQDTGSAVAQLHELTDGFAVESAYCNTHRALLEGLVRFERDLHEHVSKENNVLFPRVLDFEAKLA